MNWTSLTEAVASFCQLFQRRPPRPGPCLNFGLQLTLSQPGGQILPTTVLWVLSGLNSPLRPWFHWARIMDTQWRHKSKMWQTKYALAVPKNLGLGLNFWPCSEGNFFSGRPWSVPLGISSRQPFHCNSRTSTYTIQGAQSQHLLCVIQGSDSASYARNVDFTLKSELQTTTTKIMGLTLL